MKKTIKIFSLLLITILIIPGIASFAKTVSVYDEAYVLTDEEIITLTEKYDKVRDEYNIDVAIVIQPDLYSDTPMESADDFYDYNDYGMGANDDGILLYICTGTREYHITTHAKAIEAFNDNGIRYLGEQIVPYLEDSDYYNAAHKFADTADELLEMYANGKPYNVKPKKNVVIPILIAVGVSVALAFIFTKSQLSKMKTANKQKYANDYVKDGSMQIDFSRDIFLYSRIHKSEKPKSNSSSSTHTSSSGRTHGGGGGSF